MKFACFLILIVISLTLAFGNNNLYSDESKVKTCDSSAALCEMETNNSFITHSLEVNRGKGFRIRNSSNNVLFYLIERPASIFKKNQSYDSIIIKDTTYLYMAIPADTTSRTLKIRPNATPGEQFSVRVFGLTEYQPLTSPKIIIKNGDKPPKK
jgi:hypothetical protein